ncbi:hypothetical protein BDZ91DRAFT_716504 [Kalaharituber pfeilii]|nr:hypothetical protein BDZ91DRAFT_716504 [Kalaharituber pfeilii]
MNMRANLHMCCSLLALISSFTWVLSQGLPPLGRGKTHIISVGRREGDQLALRFTPEETFAEVGDFIQFQFYPIVSIRYIVWR